jgi:hypothetical protein
MGVIPAVAIPAAVRTVARQLHRCIAAGDRTSSPTKHFVWRMASRQNLHRQMFVFWVAVTSGVVLATLFIYLVERVVADQATLIRGTAVLCAQIIGFGIVRVGRDLILDRWLFKLADETSHREASLKCPSNPSGRSQIPFTRAQLAETFPPRVETSRLLPGHPDGSLIRASEAVRKSATLMSGSARHCCAGDGPTLGNLRHSQRPERSRVLQASGGRCLGLGFLSR